MADQQKKPREGFKSFKSESGSFHELKELDEIEGILIAVRQQRIRDKRTKLPKDILVYRIQLDSGELISLGGRTMLDKQMLDACDSMFGGDWNAMKGAEVVISRGEDVKTSEGNPLGTYEVLIRDSRER